MYQSGVGHLRIAQAEDQQVLHAGRFELEDAAGAAVTEQAIGLLVIEAEEIVAGKGYF